MGGKERGRSLESQFLVVLLILGTISAVFGANVTYDHRAVVIDGKRRVLVSGSIHYPRSTPEMWPDIVQKSKDGGLDVIETYVFWNIHEPVRGQYDFEGRKDLVKFVKTVADAGLFVHLRIGPYVCAEWNYGGFPVWLHFIPGIQLRTDNEPFKAEMQRFTAMIVELMKQNSLFASLGGPIILSQIENEYGNVASQYGAGAKPYINWAASMATSLGTGVPWVMCQQGDAPDPIINACNGFYCDQFTPNSNNKPKIWTENWSGWFLSFGGAVPYRPAEDLAFAVARFFMRGGTFQNYYMYHGGTNFGRTSGGPFITTSYDYDSPIDEYGILRQPKWGHLRDVHMAIKLCEEALLATDPSISSLGSNLEAAIYETGSGSCSAFLANTGTSDVTVTFNGNSYQLPAWSVSILPDCNNVALNTAKINAISTDPRFTNEPLKYSLEDASNGVSSRWSWLSEPVGISKANAFTRTGLLEQINTTADKSDYMWYSLSIVVPDESQAVLHVESLGHVFHAFVNKKLSGSKVGNNGNSRISADISANLVPGRNTIDLLSVTVGLQNYGAYFDKRGAGITGPVILKFSSSGSTIDLSMQEWTYQVGLKGEDDDFPSGSSSWTTQPKLLKNKPLTWYKTQFDAPIGNDPVALDFTGLGKGEAWVNGQSIGRYWPTYISPGSGCVESCNYRGSYSSSKCLKNCGKPSQQLYHVPRSWLRPSLNTLVLFEEVGGDPAQLSFATRRVTTVCAHVSESHPLPISAWTKISETGTRPRPMLSLACPGPDQVISSINFASFGNPSGGTCGGYSHGECRSPNAHSIVQEACMGLKNCSIEVTVDTFGEPCRGVVRSLAVEASCA
ncbi:hypothetical protein MLD38_004016 [Melastoma candidum]|uniref:Uncharacterized protein n=1 Tax=Melastoma candidum TaxID=119954 RepID=A0ACB9S7J7_9MYRT|nr:hypothetical protein MLD38_004016 [Melastoma candidum]